jgi:isocitrate dehydrogenase kinase/phosphatase
MLNAEAPERFSTRFLESLEFKSTNDRLFINVLRELGFIDTDGIPKDRYYQFLDKSQSARIVAEGIKEAYSDLFAVNKNAQKLSAEEVKNKLRTLYKGAKKDDLIGRIASTFTALCEYADFSATPKPTTEAKTTKDTDIDEISKAEERKENLAVPKISLDSLQYHINIVLPESRDQAVYDAIFKSLRDHLGGS